MIAVTNVTQAGCKVSLLTSCQKDYECNHNENECATQTVNGDIPTIKRRNRNFRFLCLRHCRVTDCSYAHDSNPPLFLSMLRVRENRVKRPQVH